MLHVSCCTFVLLLRKRLAQSWRALVDFSLSPKIHIQRQVFGVPRGGTLFGNKCLSRRAPRRNLVWQQMFAEIGGDQASQVANALNGTNTVEQFAKDTPRTQLAHYRRVQLDYMHS